MTLNDWFNKGIEAAEYESTLDKLKEGYERISSQFSLPDDDAFIESLKAKNLRAVVLAETWCGHCMLNIPILLHIAKAANMPVRFLRRDENLELMDQYLTNGKSRTIPIMIFINEKGEEVAKWGPIANTTKTFVAPLKEKLPEKGTPAYDEKFQEMIKITATAFQERTDLWNGVYDSIKSTLQ